MNRPSTGIEQWVCALVAVVSISGFGCEADEASAAPAVDGAVSSETSIDASSEVAEDSSSAASDSAADSTDSGSTACPAAMPTIGSACSFVGDDVSFSTTPVCKYQDPTSPAGSICPWFLACSSGHVTSAGTETVSKGCPTAPPVDGTSCTCGEHGFGESSSGRCEYPCAGGTIVARCDLGGKLAATAPGSVKWSVTSCAPGDAGTD